MNNMKNNEQQFDENLISTFIEVKLAHPDDFLKIKETLTRIGVLSKRTNVLYQSCHILHKKGRYYILSFKELFLLDGRESTIDDDDRARRNAIVKMLAHWELLQIVTKDLTEYEKVSNINVIPFRDKDKYELRTKYTIGIKH